MSIVKAATELRKIAGGGIPPRFSVVFHFDDDESKENFERSVANEFRSMSLDADVLDEMVENLHVAGIRFEFVPPRPYTITKYGPIRYAPDAACHHRMRCEIGENFQGKTVLACHHCGMIFDPSPQPD